jgi:hypothetical protein
MHVFFEKIKIYNKSTNNYIKKYELDLAEHNLIILKGAYISYIINKK